jgi:hypothetical protein
MSVSFLNVQNKNLPRGLRNNNLGNLRISAVKWQGKVPVQNNTDKSFEQFENVTFGIRAMLTDVANDITIKKFNTLTKLVTSYAPPSENDTVNYINFVSKYTGINPNQELKLDPVILGKIVKAKILIENGANTINKYLPNLDNLITEAIDLLNPATKKRINWVKSSLGFGAVIAIFAMLFFLTKKS